MVPMTVANLLMQASPIPLPSTYGEGLLIVGIAAALGVLYKDKLRDQSKLDKADEEKKEQFVTLRAASDAMSQMVTGFASIKDGFGAMVTAMTSNHQELLRELRELRARVDKLEGPPS